MTNTQSGTNLERILVVDDTPEFIEVAKRVYSGLGEVRYATNLDEALHYLREEHFDFVISDMFCPGTDFAVKELYERRLKALGINTSESPIRTRPGNPECNPDHPMYVGPFSELREEPYGLAVIDGALERGVPFVVLSQGGNRHRRELGTVRYSIDNGYEEVRELKDSGQITQEEANREYGFLMSNQPHGAFGWDNMPDGKIDKSTNETWVMALDTTMKFYTELI